MSLPLFRKLAAEPLWDGTLPSEVTPEIATGVMSNPMVMGLGRELGRDSPAYMPFDTQIAQRAGPESTKNSNLGYYLSNPGTAVNDYGFNLGRGHTGTLVGTGVGLAGLGLGAYALYKLLHKSEKPAPVAQA